MESAEKGEDIVLAGGMFQHLKEETFEGVIVNDGEDAKRTVIQFIGGEVAGEVGECPVQIIGFDS